MRQLVENGDDFIEQGMVIRNYFTSLDHYNANGASFALQMTVSSPQKPRFAVIAIIYCSSL